MEQRLEAVPGNAFEISQPIQLRFNELISGVRSDLGIKLYGDDLDQLLKSGSEIAKLLNTIEGAEGVKVEQIAGLPVLSVEPIRAALYRYGLNVTDVQEVLAAAAGGEEAGQVFQGDQRFAIVVRLPEQLSSLSDRSGYGGIFPTPRHCSRMASDDRHRLSWRADDVLDFLGRGYRTAATRAPSPGGRGGRRARTWIPADDLAGFGYLCLVDAPLR